MNVKLCSSWEHPYIQLENFKCTELKFLWQHRINIYINEINEMFNKPDRKNFSKQL